MNRILVAFVAAGAAHAAGCTSARYVQRGMDEGVVAVPDRSNSWPSFNNDKAINLIKEHVGPDYEIVEDYPSSTGPQPPRGNGLTPVKDPSTNNQMFFMPNDTRPRALPTNDQAHGTEVHIRYRKKSVGGASGWLPPATTMTTAAGLPTPAGKASGARTALAQGVIPAGLRQDQQPLILPAAASEPAPPPNSTNPVMNIPPPILPAMK